MLFVYVCTTCAYIFLDPYMTRGLKPNATKNMPLPRSLYAYNKLSREHVSPYCKNVIMNFVFIMFEFGNMTYKLMPADCCTCYFF